MTLPRSRADMAGTPLCGLDVREESDVDGAWASEIERRIQEVDAGKVKLVPWNRTYRRLRAGLRSARAKA